MPKKYLTLILCYSSLALGSLDGKEKQLIDAVHTQYTACQKRWNNASRALSRGKKKTHKVATLQAKAQERNRMKAEQALAAYQAKHGK